jgi:hypothetical protein
MAIAATIKFQHGQSERGQMIPILEGFITSGGIFCLLAANDKT